MSYILDALRRADAERERGHVPGIHAQPGMAAPASSAPPASRPWPWIALGAAAVAAVALGAWYELTPPSRGAVDATPPANPIGKNLPPVARTTPDLTPLAPPPLAEAPKSLPPMPAPLPSPPRPAPPDSMNRAPSTLAPPAVSTIPPSGNPAAAAEKIYSMGELPPDIRGQLPPLVVGGSMYSSNAADRILIINGQVAHEGDRLGNDLVLKQIRLKNAVLEFRGYRFMLAF